MERRLDKGKKHSRTNNKSCSVVSNTLDFSLYRLRWPSSCNFSYISQFGYSLSLYVSHFSRYINSLCNNTFHPKMQLKHHPHNFNMMNTRSLAVLPNPSDTKVATLIISSYHDTFLHYFQDNVSVYSPG